MFIAHGNSNKRVTLRTNILETKLIGISFKVSFDEAALFTSYSLLVARLKPARYSM